MTTVESERRERLRPTFKDGDIPAELDNPLALGLIELRDVGGLSMRIFGQRDSIETDFYVGPRGDKTLSSEELINFTRAFTEKLAESAQVSLVDVRQIRSGESAETYDSTIFKYEEKGAYGRIIIYPSETHVSAVAQANDLEGLQRDYHIDFSKEISSLREVFPK